MERKFKDIIKETRIKKNISQRELARRIDVDIAYINKIENGKILKPSLNVIMKICNVLELDTIDMIYRAYTYRETEILNVINNDNDIFNWINENNKKEINKVIIKDKNNNERVSLIKLLENYKNNEINIKETIAILSYMLNNNMFDYLTEEEINKIENNK